ncbi:MAG: hypothetical protein OET90_04300 [Desulfuromonadales bacterium]|nr:hypothetical protein [Desulfuromonadales bacterium]
MKFLIIRKIGFDRHYIGNMTNSTLDKDADFVEAFRTGRIWEVELVAYELEKEGVPFYQQEQASSGLRLAKPFAAAMGPGVWWLIYVPQASHERVNAIISGLPIDVTKNPGVWHYNASGKPSKWFRWYFIVMLLFFAVYVINGLIDLVAAVK